MTLTNARLFTSVAQCYKSLAHVRNRPTGRFSKLVFVETCLAILEMFWTFSVQCTTEMKAIWLWVVYFLFVHHPPLSTPSALQWLFAPRFCGLVKWSLDKMYFEIVCLSCLTKIEARLRSHCDTVSFVVTREKKYPSASIAIQYVTYAIQKKNSKITNNFNCPLTPFIHYM